MAIRYEIAQRKAVVAGDKIDARLRPPIARRKDIRRAAKPRREFAQEARITAPKATERVAGAAVPLAKGRGESPELVAVLAQIPGLRDQLDSTQHWILMERRQPPRAPIKRAVITGQGRRKIEAKAVDLHLLDPIAQAVHHQAQGLGMAEIQAVAAATRVGVTSRVLDIEAVISGVVKAAQAQGRP